MSQITQRLLSLKSLSWWTLIGLFAFILILAITIGAPFPLSWDTMGYYAYLSEYFVDGDLLIEDLSHYQHVMNTYDNTASLYQFVPIETGGFITKYTAGWSVMNAPFMFMGHYFAGWLGYPQDGFSKPYEIASLISSLFYTFLGLVLMRKLLLKFCSEKLVSLCLVILVLGTNYLHMNYSCIGLSHVFIFPLYALLLLLTYHFNKARSVKLAVAIGLTLGLMVLVRPTEGIALIIPLLYGVGSLQSFKNRIREFFTTKHFYFILLCMLAVYGIQMIYWKLTAGTFLFYTYTNLAEGLDFNRPHLLEVLFSFRKGWLLYTPIMLFMILGFVKLYKRNKELFWPLFIFTIINLYVVSSWTVWWYTGSFSQRALEHSYPVYVLVIAFALVGLSQIKKIVYGSFIGFFLLLNLFQTWQVQNGVLHFSAMTKEYYFSIFGQTSAPTVAQKNLLLIDRSKTEFSDPEKYGLIKTVEADFELPMTLSETNPYSPLIQVKYSELTQKDHLWIVAKAEVEKLIAIDDNQYNSPEFSIVHLCVNMQYEGQNYAWTNSTLENDSSRFQKLKKEYLTPDLRTDNDQITVGLWHQLGPEIKINKLFFEVYERK